MIAAAALPLGWNVAIFAAAALAILFAGTRLTRDADHLADRTGLGEASVLLLSLLHRERRGPAGIGFESCLLLILYGTGVALLVTDAA